MRKRLTQSRWSRLIPLAGALVLLTTSAFAQMPMPSMYLQGEKKRALTPEEQERQKQPIRPTPSTPSPKTAQGSLAF